MGNYYIGWDVGTWSCTNANKSSCDALVVMDDEVILGHHRDNLSLSIESIYHSSSDTKAQYLIESWFTKCNLQRKYLKDDHYIIAIDTPLGWPKGFANLLKGAFPKKWTFCCNDSDIKNPLLHRKTDRELGLGFSVVTHSIGNQSTKGMSLLCVLEALDKTWGVWQKDNITLLETYPKACLLSEAFVRWITQMTLKYDIREWYHPVNKKTKKKEKRIKVQDDTFDAGVCACLAKAYATNSIELVRPPDDDQSDEKAEGWIFYPAPPTDS